MSGTSPLRQDPRDVPGGGVSAAEALPDPWGIRRAEHLLTSLEGVLSARVVTTPLGEVSEIHILAQAGIQAKQMVRNIESALLAHLGLKVDHRKISIAQTAEVKPLEALEAGAVRERSLRRTILFEEMAVAASGRHQRVTVTVTLSAEGRTETAGDEVVDTPRGRVEGAARATAAVLDRLLEKHGVTLEGAKLVHELDRQVVFAVLRGLGGRETVTLTGTAEVRESPEQAAVLAVLDATNRWLAARKGGAVR